eukprot:XP_784671.3 PREDICTED: uncharacterized protein LOC579463 [Strongylocentrotus purpuratus]
MSCRGMLVCVVGFVVLLAGLPLGNAQLPIPNSANYIGVGYNFIMGNPEGDSLNSGGVDPGLLASRNIFELTYDLGKKSKDNKYRVPDETEFLQRSSAFTTKEKSTFHGTKSYAKTLSSKVQESASLDAVFASVKFAGSHDYKQISEDEKKEGYVYFTEQTIQNLGTIRYLDELARADQFEITRNFYADVCGLPVTYESQKKNYMDFIDKWGTHVVTELQTGVRSGTTYRATRSSFVKLASEQRSDSLSLEGHYKIASASISVNMDKFTEDKSAEKKFGSQYTTYKVGSETLHEPISLKLLGLNELLADDKYWTTQASHEGTLCPVGWERPLIAANILKAYKGYIEYKNIAASTDLEVRIPLTWPDGQYALAKPARNGGTCPNTDYLTWDEGNRLEITQPLGANWWSKDTQHLSDNIFMESAQVYYCVKSVAQSSTTSWKWMPGSYCIYQFGNTCPNGFDSGYLKYDDDDTSSNQANGILPAGEYTSEYTLIRFCCRNDASPMHPIFLPTDSSFFLVRYFDNCQKVSGMTDTEEFFELDTMHAGLNVDNDDAEYGAFPQPGVVQHTRVKIFFCYYQPQTKAKRVDDAIERIKEELAKKVPRLARKGPRWDVHGR